MALGHLDELQKAEKYPIRWSLKIGFTVTIHLCDKFSRLVLVKRGPCDNGIKAWLISTNIRRFSVFVGAVISFLRKNIDATCLELKKLIAMHLVYSKKLLKTISLRCIDDSWKIVISFPGPLLQTGIDRDYDMDNNRICCFIWDLIIHPRPNFNGGFAQSLGRGRVIDQPHKSGNALVPYPTMHHQNGNDHINVNISVLNCALWNMGQVHCGICEFGQSVPVIPALDTAVYKVVITQPCPNRKIPVLSGLAKLRWKEALVWSQAAERNCTYQQASSVMKFIYILYYTDGLAQDCSNSNALSMVLLQSCAKPSIET